MTQVTLNVISVALANMERDPDNKQRREQCVEAIRSAIAELEKFLRA
jgi:hypothetical protein